ncbi:DUF2125 domain-containing protein [Mesorhizobium sp. 10J20-29]
MAVTDEKQTNYGRRIFWLGVFVIVLCAGYTAGWYYLAGAFEKSARQTIAKMNSNGVSADCENPVARGFPFRLGLYCDRVSFSDPAEAVGFTAGEFRSAGQIYDPFRFVAELDGPAMVDTPGSGALNLDWDIMRASVRWAEPLPERVSLEGGNVAASLVTGKQLGTVGDFQAHLRPNGQDLDIATSFDNLIVDPSRVDGRTLPPLSGQTDLTIDNGVGLVGTGIQNLRGQSGTIREASLFSGPKTGLTISGPFSIGEDGLIDADLKITVRNPNGLSTVLAAAFPENSDEIIAGVSALSFMGNAPSLPLTIKKGRANISFVKLGNIPPL